MQIRRTEKYVYDVFLGTGFDQWVRVRKYKWGYRILNGVRVAREAMKEMIDRLDKYPDGSLENV